MLLYTADVLLSYRALCLWRMNRTLLIINCIIFVVCSLASTTLIGFAIAHFTIYPTLKDATGCYSSDTAYYFVAPIPGECGKLRSLPCYHLSDRLSYPL